MRQTFRYRWLRGLFLGSVFALPLLLATGAAQEKPKAKEPPQAPPLPVVPVVPPKVIIVPRERHGHVIPAHTVPRVAHTGGGNTEVAQPQEDMLVVTMTGVAVAGPHPHQDSAAGMEFKLKQEFAIAFVDKKVTKARLSAEMHVMGLLRGDKRGGGASMAAATTVVVARDVPMVALDIEGHAVHGDSNLAITDHKGPATVTVLPGEYGLFQRFRISAEHARSILGTAACAEFAPDPALNPQWISYRDPFAGVNKSDFGFRVILRVEPE